MRIPFYRLFFIVIVPFLTACNNNSESNDGSNVEYAGGNNVIRIAEVNLPGSIFPQRITSAVEGLIASQIHEGLVKINPKDLTVIPGLAEKWEVSPDGKTITFHLRKGVNFQSVGDLAGKSIELTTKDVKFTFELLCTDRPNNVHYQTVCKDRVVGANEFYLASTKGEKQELKGLKIIDDYTFSISLLNSRNIFLEILANPVASIINQSSYESKGENSNIGMGPFILAEKASTKRHIVLYKNANYYAKGPSGEALPYLDSIIIDIVPSLEEGLRGFKSGVYDLISSVPNYQLKQMVAENIQAFKGNPALYNIDQRPEMISSYYLFNVNNPPFNNKKLRQAFNYAIDRDRIIERALFGQAHGPAINGIVPPSFAFYKSTTITGYTLNIPKAKQLLKEAGYPEGKGLSEVLLLINAGSSRHITVAAEIQKQLKANLNVNITFEGLNVADKFYYEVKGKGNLYREGWVADYPSPESFLSIFYGETVTSDTNHLAYPNTIKYKNAEFDKFYKLGRDALNRDTATQYFLKAEQILVNDAPLIPLWYDSNCRLISSRVKGFQSNAMRYFDFTQVSVEEEEKKK